MKDIALKLQGLRVKIGEEEVILEIRSYRNDRLAVTARCKEGCPYCTLTVNLEDKDVPHPHAFWVKVGGAEQHLAKVLESQGVLRPLNVSTSAGYVKHYADLWEIVP